MRKVVYGQDQRFIQWAAERIGVTFRSDAVAIGLEDSTGIRAAVIFDSFTAVDCCMHVASDGSRLWLNREYLAKCFAYPFIQCGFARVTGLVPASNKDALRFDLHLGFKEEGRCRQAAPDGGDIVVLGMLASECRFIPSGITKEARHA